MKAYLYHLLIACDQLANAILMGSADETLSARAYRVERAGKVFGKVFRPSIDLLAVVLTLGYDTDHCRESYESEVKRKQLPSVYVAMKFDT